MAAKHLFIEPLIAPVKMKAAVPGGQLIIDSVNNNGFSGNPVGIAANNAPDIKFIRQVFSRSFITQHNVGKAPYPVRHANRHDCCAEVSQLYFAPKPVGKRIQGDVLTLHLAPGDCFNQWF